MMNRRDIAVINKMLEVDLSAMFALSKNQGMRARENERMVYL
jgi:hypothetical protein